MSTKENTISVQMLIAKLLSSNNNMAMTEVVFEFCEEEEEDATPLTLISVEEGVSEKTGLPVVTILVG